MHSKYQVVVKIKRLTNDAVIPKYEHDDDSGADLYAAEECTLEPMERRAISTGLSVEIPPEVELQIRPKSGLAIKYGLTVLNTPGTIDAGYRGEIKVILINLGSEAFTLRKGYKIAQLVVVPIMKGCFEEVENLSQSKRGAGGFGSTGMN